MAASQRKRLTVTSENFLIYVVLLIVLATVASVVYGAAVYQRENKSNLYISLALAAAFAWITSIWGQGIFVKLSIIVMMVWLPYSAIVMLFRPARRWAQLARVVIWVGAVALAGGIHYVRHEAVMKRANEITAAVMQYTAAHGHCPATMDEIGVSREQLRNDLGRADYRCEGGKPEFFFLDSYDGFDRYHYDFDAKGWVFQPD